ncbi:MAG TPA: DUF4845 domain-containing protein [Methylophaga aminisulfidivorans]|uniref:DUF4845 domain-containing protein n=1 Tax=Methylophaga aminisulfidivorans TaxID=230105 RepID=A0A7C1ZUW6_9GAMM|nr:DUF4845 domain-containing protein [Methylophaga aminisulfidivorans]
MKRQQGMTLIGWVIVMALIAFFATLAMRLVPMYQEYYGVVQIMNDMKIELRNNNLSKNEVKTLMARRFNIGYISSVTKDDVEIFRGKNTAYVTKIVIDYEVRKPFFAQIDLVGHFHKEIDVEPPK